MKKRIIAKILLLCMLVSSVGVLTSCGEEPAEIVPQSDTTVVAKEEPKAEKKIKPASMKNTLFIGDSRTVGLMDYAGLKGPHYFCYEGMNVFDIKKDVISVPSIGKVTLDELLSQKEYDRIYVMLGINELGYPLERVADSYEKLVKFIEKRQPNTKIILQANLHVSKKRSQEDKYINNKRINWLNKRIAKMANSNNIFYIDANPLFDDKKGNLAKKKTPDQVHLYAKGYKKWGKWIRKETTRIAQED